jgi:SAM-dependent methyltransferase
MAKAARKIDGDQADLWNGAGGRGWVELQGILDGVLAPLEARLVAELEEIATRPVERLLDVGCGTGGTTVAIGRRLGPGSDCTGVDISEPMIAAARIRSERESVPSRFVLADAQRHQFEPASFDLVVSRLGVMFFDDFVAAFANLRAAAKRGGALRFIAWRPAEENPFTTTAERAAAPLIDVARGEPDAPGMFALADERRVHSVLERSGWAGIEIQPIDVTCTLPEKDLVLYLTKLGPVGRALAGADTATRDRVVEAIRPAFDPYVDRSEVRFNAACWMVAARA